MRRTEERRENVPKAARKMRRPVEKDLGLW